jgi:hypothetical protein
MNKDQFEVALKSAFEDMNGIYTLTQFEELE